MTKKSPILKGRAVNQDIGTPSIFVEACRKVFGDVVFDLAASKTNHVVDDYYTPKDDSMDASTPWPRYRKRKQEVVLTEKDPYLTWNWLNPPYSNIFPWADRCAYETEKGCDILMLVPASTDTAWWDQWVDGTAWWCGLKGRIKFEGHDLGYPRALALVIFSNAWKPVNKHLVRNGFSDRLYRNTSSPGYLGQWDWTKCLEKTSRKTEE